MIRVPLLILILLFVASGIAIAQQEKIDSLKSLLPGRTDLERADIFYELAYEYGDSNYALASEYSGQSLQFAKKTGDSLRIVKAGRIKATVFRRLEEMDSAIVLGLEILPIASRNQYRIEVNKILRGVALAYTYKANYDLGLRYNFELLKATEQDNDSLEMAYVLNNIGLIYYKLNNRQTALKYYHRVLDVKSSHDNHPLTTPLLNISLCYSELGDFSKASEFLRKGFDSCNPECEGPYMLEVYQACGSFHFCQGNLDSAVVYYLKSYSLARKLGNKRYQLSNALVITDIYFQQDQISLATRYLAEVELTMQQAPFGYELIKLYAKLSLFYKRTGNVKKRIFYQEKCAQLVDSIYSRQLTNNLMKIESDYLERKNKAKIAEQEGLLTVKDQVIWWQNALNILLAIIAALLVALLYVLYHTNRQRRSVSQFLDRKVKERTAELESSYLVLKQSFEEGDVAITETFMEIKSSAGVIKRLCTVGLETEYAEPAKCLEEISLLTGRVSSVLIKIRANKSSVTDLVLATDRSLRT